uniref:alpha/beta hydrolase family protein n=1 Tax=Agathobacter sp. TaxID=2021311 RepID=UPI003FEE9CF7
MKKKITFLLIIMSVLILTVLIFRIKSPSGISVEDAQKQMENSLEANGISEYEKIDLGKYEKQAGVDLSTYISYRFFYQSDDLKIEAFISAPVDLLGKKKSPCLIYNHGGNREYGALENVETTFYAYQFHTICVATNYRGCGSSQGTDAFGGDDVRDVIHLIDLCQKLDYVDTNQINMLGVSRGGMMTYETLREDKRIHKAVVVAGVADCSMSYEERSDMQPLLKELIGGTPKQLPEEYEKRSAVAWADQINTPLLIFHTTGDDKVSVKQADKLVEQLKKYQKDYEYVTFDSHVHGDLRKTDVEKINKWLQ